MSNPYLQSKVMTASAGQILVMLYDGAIRFTRQATERLEQDRALDALVPMSRALAIVQELQANLNSSHAPELCDRLELLYLFLQEQILIAQREKTPEPLRVAASILKELREAWSQAVDSAGSSQVRRAG